LFDTSFKDGVLPLSWKIANLTPVHKKDQPLNGIDPSNYRPIGSVCTIANRSQNLNHRVYDINNHELVHVNSIRDVGVTIDGHLKFDKHILHKAMSRTYLILLTFYS